ncbi:MAG: ABC transporter permease [Lachnospiraceae bacterium]|nr:ABC transporter permease [Lachnospiraceae bacterium]
MKTSQAFWMAFSSLKSNRMRAFLTMLGMIIGVGAVIAMISLMDGMIGYTMGSFSDMGADTISVSLMGAGSRQLTDDDFYNFVEANGDYFSAVSPSCQASFRVRCGEVRESDQTVTGVGENHAYVNGLTIEKGRFLSYADMRSRSKVCVIGSYTRQLYFGAEDPVGKTLRIGSEDYVIVGLLAEKSDSTQWSSDDCIYAPYTLISRAYGSAQPSSYTLKMVDPDHSSVAQQKLEDYLYSFYHTSDAYMVTNMASLLDMMDSMVGVMKKILVGIAGISLLVAGIGIMNIMLVSVSERTREIGIRKSLGAKQKDIMKQFVIEAAVLSSIGGGMGIVIGGVATTALGKVIGMSCSPSLSAIVISFGVSAGIGLLFGYMPAKRAAKLNPIDALRSE